MSSLWEFDLLDELGATTPTMTEVSLEELFQGYGINMLQVYLQIYPLVAPLHHHLLVPKQNHPPISPNLLHYSVTLMIAVVKEATLSLQYLKHHMVEPPVSLQARPQQ